MKVYVTKYALTQGILEFDVLPEGFAEKGYVKVQKAKWFTHLWCKIGRDAFENKGEAMKRAEEMRAAKLKSLQKSIKKIEQLKF